MVHLRKELLSYRERHPDEGAVVDRFLSLLEEGSIAFVRERLQGHLTASGWTVDSGRSRVLLVHHRKLDKWLQPGGHADGEEKLPEVARKEVLEETGLETRLLAGGRILDLDVHRIPARGEVPEHEHFDVRYLLEAVGQEPAGNHESHEVRWVTVEEIEAFTGEESILRMSRKAAALLNSTSRGPGPD